MVREIALAINAGQLRTGERLPGTRALAEHLRISRNTILNPTTPSHDIRRGWVVAESIFERVSRLLSGKLQDSVDRLEQAGGAAVMREAIREVDLAIDQLRADHEVVVTRRLQAARQRKMLAEHVQKLTEKAKFAVGEGRDDLAEAALSRQIDFEQQPAQYSQVEAAAREEEQRKRC